MAPRRDVAEALRRLLDSAHLAGPDDLGRLVARSAADLGAAETVLYLADYDQTVLIPLVSGTSYRRDAVSIDGTLAGRAFTDVVPHAATTNDGATVWTPVLDGTERLGVLQVSFVEPLEDAASVHADCFAVATLVAELVMTRRLYGDAIERVRRRVPFSLAAELQWTQLPPLSFATPEVAISAVLMPTHEVAGDSFDYALNGSVLHVALIDAMGHGLQATLLSAVALGALRGARRAGLDLVDSVRSMDKHLAAAFGIDTFVTAVVGQLDIRTGLWSWITAGHPPALLVRSSRVVKELDEPVNPPLGLLAARPIVGEERLQRGDRLLLHTDGVVEARDADGEFFGTPRLVELVTREAAAGRPAPETLRRLNRAILEHQAGTLQDDATTLMVEWLGDEPDRMTV